MELLTIGAFARQARLTPKALRMYDDLGLLSPWAVDAESGYRYYHPAQLDRARLVAGLRRAGMPLARIQVVADLPRAEAAAEIESFWADLRADTAAKGEIAAFLVDVLTGRGKIMSALGLRYAAASEAGHGREGNDDFAYAGRDLLAVADGVRGHTGAASAAVGALRKSGEVALNDLAGLAAAADETVTGLGQVSTLTALIFADSRIGVVHVGDTRAYLLRQGVLSRLTQDHSHVQQLVDSGELAASDALAHPQRALLVRALGAGSEADVSLRTAIAGDRYLLCSDGLWTQLDDTQLRDALAAGGDPEETVARLLELAGEAPDDVAVVVADAV